MDEREVKKLLALLEIFNKNQRILIARVTELEKRLLRDKKFSQN